MLCISPEATAPLGTSPGSLVRPGATCNLQFYRRGFGRNELLRDNDLAGEFVLTGLQYDEVDTTLNIIRIPRRHANDSIADWRADDFVHELSGHVVDGKRHFT